MFPEICFEFRWGRTEVSFGGNDSYIRFTSWRIILYPAPGMLGGRHGGTNVGEIFGKVDFWIGFTNLNLPGVFCQLSSIS